MQNLKVMRIKPVFLALSFVSLGYFIAVCSFRRETWIHSTSGELISKVGVFPFLEQVTHRDRAFEVYFSGHSQNSADGKLMLVTRKHFFEPFRKEIYTRGEALLTAERYLVSADIERGFSLAERKEIGLEFRRRLCDGGISAAADYASGLLNGKYEIEQDNGTDRK